MAVRFMLVGADTYATLSKVYTSKVVYEEPNDVWESIKGEVNPSNGEHLFKTTDRPTGPIPPEFAGKAPAQSTKDSGELDTGASEVVLSRTSPDITMDDLKSKTPVPKPHSSRKLVVGKTGKTGPGDEAVVV